MTARPRRRRPPHLGRCTTRRAATTHVPERHAATFAAQYTYTVDMLGALAEVDRVAVFMESTTADRFADEFVAILRRRILADGRYSEADVDTFMTVLTHLSESAVDEALETTGLPWAPETPSEDDIHNAVDAARKSGVS